MEKKISNVGIVCNPNIVEKEKDFILKVLKQVQNFIKSTNGEILVEHNVYKAIGKFLKCRKCPVKESSIKDMHCDVLLVFGGDGTILHTINAVQDVPVLGINLGKFGFMTDLNKNNASEKLENLFEGNFFIENYDMLNVHDKYNAVNEVVISYKFPARLLDFKIKINKDKNDEVINFSSDGVVVATQTGSTAYSLSLGGPVIHPDANVFVITPMNSFLGNTKPLVVPSDSEIFINIERANEDTFLIIDGKVVEKVNAGDKISVKKSDKAAKFIRFEKTMRCAKIFKI
ncbi:MAG: hypothetical protein AUK59_03365 [Candidatus Altarchaeum sp. CG2_30_32_3053]|nr:MAG: hypothetical protein AUK59_03365 [Candidatus Altarchaeum sp. CG2_30_32_3053]